MQLPPADIGMPVDEIDTPALVLDLDAFERNLAKMARLAREAGVRLRPHAKTHKSTAVALRQIAHGAIGQCCQKVGEAEVLVHGGVRDVLVSNEVFGEQKMRPSPRSRAWRRSACASTIPRRSSRPRARRATTASRSAASSRSSSA